MIGILIISHSAAIAGGVKDLADQMTQGQVRIGAAGGTHDGQLGTSADLILQALEQLEGIAAVIALVDMGSAVMSAEIALELSGLPFLISGAPLVEGALVAAVEAMRPDATLEQVAAAAARALETKGIDASPPSPTAELPQPTDPSTPRASAEATLRVLNKVGLHMRPAKEFVQTASRFVCSIQVRNLDRPERPDSNAKSIVEIMKLGVSSGHQVLVRAEGDDAQAAIDALSRLVMENFGEE